MQISYTFLIGGYYGQLVANYVLVIRLTGIDMTMLDGHARELDCRILEN